MIKIYLKKWRVIKDGKEIDLTPLEFRLLKLLSSNDIVTYKEMTEYFYGNIIDENTYEQRNICLLPEFQGNGIGSKILKSIIDFYKDKDIILRCFKQNPVINLYKRLGFEISGETEYHYLMRLKRK